VLSQLGSLYEKIGELDKAMTAFQEEETICKSVKKYETQAICMKNQASIYLKKKNRRMATETAYAALQLARLHKLKATEKEIQVFFRKI
jgi:virulence-associated protein VapD